jgi:hypothetical protein
MHIHNVIHIEASLTVDALSSVLDGVKRLDRYGGVGIYLQIPVSKLVELQRQYNNRQLPRAFSTVYLTEVPSPSWSILALALWQGKEHGALEVVQKLYLKGEPCHTAVGVKGELVAY